MPRDFVVKRTRQADEDLIEIWLHIARDSEKHADQFIDQIETATNQLAQNPNLGLARDDIAEGFRYFPAQRYLLFYRAIINGIELVRVIHSARDLKKVFS